MPRSRDIKPLLLGHQAGYLLVPFQAVGSCYHLSPSLRCELLWVRSSFPSKVLHNHPIYVDDRGTKFLG